MKLHDLLEVMVYHQDITISARGVEIFKGLCGHALYLDSEVLQSYLNDQVIIVSTIIKYQIDIDLK